MIFALDYFLAAVVFLKDHFFKDHSFIQAGCCLFFVGKSPGPYSLKKGLHLQNVIPKDWNLKNPLEQWETKNSLFKLYIGGLYNPLLGGGFKYFLFSPLLGEDFQFD